jgi:FixJ family two-component response regulator
MGATSVPLKVVHIVDDDANLRRAIARLLRSHGCDTHTYASASEFLHTQVPNAPACPRFTDARFNRVGSTGTIGESQKQPSDCIHIVSSHGNIPSSVQAMKAGAIDFLTKPFDEEQLIIAVMPRSKELGSHNSEIIPLPKTAMRLSVCRSASARSAYGSQKGCSTNRLPQSLEQRKNH